VSLLLAAVPAMRTLTPGEEVQATREAPTSRRGYSRTIAFMPPPPDRAYPDQVLDESAFKHVWDVLKALRAHDEALGEELDELRRRLGAQRSPPRRPGKIKLDVPAGRVGAQFIHAFNARLIEQTTASWEFYRGLLERFAEREGHTRVPMQWREDDYLLGKWVHQQRTNKRLGTLREERRAGLEAIPGWTWYPRATDWEEGFAHLQSFVEREGHARVPTDYRDDNGHRLGMWVVRQRYGESTLHRERHARLEALPGWTWEPQAESWEEGFAHLQRFVEREGHARVPDEYSENAFELGTWVGKQRARHRQGTIAPDRRRRLDSLPGWTWDALKASWEEGFANLVRFVEREGHARVPARWRENGYRLGQWVTVQRTNFAAGRLDKVRGNRLEALPRWTWEPFAEAWDEGFAHLQRFVGREGHARVPYGHRADGFRLGQWVANQRAKYRYGALDPQRQALLEDFPGWSWNAREAAWDEALAYLQRFVEREGHARVPQQWQEDGFRLGGWVNRQRTQYSDKTLDPERHRRLEALPGWTWDARES